MKKKKKKKSNLLDIMDEDENIIIMRAKINKKWKIIWIKKVTKYE